MTIKNDLTVAFVSALALLAPKRLKIVLPADDNKAKKANKIYSTLDRILFFIKNKRPTLGESYKSKLIIEYVLCSFLWNYELT